MVAILDRGKAKATTIGSPKRRKDTTQDTRRVDDES